MHNYKVNKLLKNRSIKIVRGYLFLFDSKKYLCKVRNKHLFKIRDLIRDLCILKTKKA